MKLRKPVAYEILEVPIFLRVCLLRIQCKEKRHRKAFEIVLLLACFPSLKVFNSLQNQFDDASVSCLFFSWITFYGSSAVPS